MIIDNESGTTEVTPGVGYRKTKLGMLPNEWAVIPIKKAMVLINGYAFKPEDWKENGTPIIRIQNLNDSNAAFNYCDSELDPKYLIRSGDILFAWSGTKGVSFGARVWNRENGYLNQHIFKVLVDRALLTRQYGFLALMMAQDSIEKQAHGFKSSFVHVKKADLEKILLPIPPLDEQEIITNILSCWEESINKLQQLIAAKEKRKKALMQQLLTGKKRLAGFQEEWKEVKIKAIAKEVSLRNKEDRDLTVLSCTKYKGLVPSLEYFGRRVFSVNVATYKVVPRRCFAYATNHIEEGSIGYQSDYKEALISPMYTVFKTDQSVNDDFFFLLLKSHIMLHEYQRRMEGSIDRRGGLRWKEFSGITIKLASLIEQDAIASVLQDADKELSLLQIKLEKLKEQKKGLMQVLLTGRVRIKN